MPAKFSEKSIHKAFWQGSYETCKVLLTSPRMNKTQREVIEEQAWKAIDKLKELGVEFKDESDKSSARMSATTDTGGTHVHHN